MNEPAIVPSTGPQAELPLSVRVTRQLRYNLPAVLVFVGVLVFWEVMATILNLRQFILPRPSAIGAALIAEWPTLQAAAGNTLFEAVGGLTIGVIIGVVVAFAVARWSRAREAILPIAIGISAIPIIAVAPIMSNWFGITNPMAKMAVVVLLVFFPIMINVVRGLTEVDARAIELMRANAASDGQVMRKLRLPNALPYFFTGPQGRARRSVSSGPWWPSTSVARARCSVGSSSRARAACASTSRGRPSWSRRWSGSPSTCSWSPSSGSSSPGIRHCDLLES